MSQASASEPAIMAMPVEVLDTTVQNTKPQQIHHTETKQDEPRDEHKTVPVLSTSTISETSDHSSSLLWTPQNVPATHSTRSNARRSHRKKNARRLYKQEMSSMTEETSPFLSTQGQQAHGIKEKNLYSFERDYPQHRYSYTRRSGRNLERNSSKRSPKHKRRHELYNDYTKYQYHRRSHKDKHKKRKSLHERKDETQNRTKNGLPTIIQRIKNFFLGKKTNKGSYHVKKEAKEYDKAYFEEFSRPVKNHHRREPSGKLFRSASDSDIEVVKHHHRRKHRNTQETQDDLFKNHKHWKTKRFHDDNKLSSICESSDRMGALERRSGSDGRLVLAKSGNTTYNDIKFHSGHKQSEHTREERKNRHRKKEEKDTSDGSHSIRSSRHEGRHRKRNKDYQSLKKKWAKQHQSFENDLEKLEKLVELINMKNSQGWLEQKPSENTTLLERLEAKQEKCVAEVDFTRHVLICKLQRLENKLEESLSTVDYNHNTVEERESSIAEIREEMSKECHDLRKLLQETSDQLKHVLEEKTGITTSEKETVIMEDQKTDNYEYENVNKECSSGQKSLNEDNETRPKDALGNPDIPFPELSHHPLNKGYPRHQRMNSDKKDTEDKRHKPTRMSTYV